MARRRGPARTRGEVCGDFGGRTDDGRPCQRPTSSGPCRDHREQASRARGSASAVLQRRRQVERYVLRRVSPAEISTLLQVSLRTVYRDLQALRRQRGKRLAPARELKEAVEDMVSLYHERQRALWLQLSEERNGAVRLGILRALREEDAQILEVLQSLGQLPKEADRVRVESWEDELRKLAMERGTTMPLADSDGGDGAEVVH
jgi:transposase